MNLMKFRAIKPHTQIPLPNGTCFTAQGLPYPNGDMPKKGSTNAHPFLVLQSNADGNCVLCAMIETLECKYEGKDKTSRLISAPDQFVELDEPYPPIESKATRRSHIDVATLTWIPKKAIFDDPTFRLCVTGAELQPSPVMDKPVDAYRNHETGEIVKMTQYDYIKQRAADLYNMGRKDARVNDLWDYARLDQQERDKLYSLSDYELDPMYVRLAIASKALGSAAKAEKEPARAPQDQPKKGKKGGKAEKKKPKGQGRTKGGKPKGKASRYPTPYPDADKRNDGEWDGDIDY